MSTTPLSSEETELEDEPTQLHRLVDVIKYCLHHAQEEIEHATMALRKEQ
jgi:hypothetical protein